MYQKDTHLEIMSNCGPSTFGFLYQLKIGHLKKIGTELSIIVFIWKYL